MFPSFQALKSWNDYKLSNFNLTQVPHINLSGCAVGVWEKAKVTHLN